MAAAVGLRLLRPRPRLRWQRWQLNWSVLLLLLLLPCRLWLLLPLLLLLL